MATIIQKSIKGNLSELIEIYDAHKHGPVLLELKTMNNLVTVACL